MYTEIKMNILLLIDVGLIMLFGERDRDVAYYVQDQILSQTNKGKKNSSYVNVQFLSSSLSLKIL